MQSAKQANLNTFFKKCLSQTLNQDGDTKANGVIVGGLIGALVGYNKIPKAEVEVILNYDCENAKLPRPRSYSVRKHAILQVDKLIECRPFSDVEIAIMQLNDPEPVHSY